MIVSYDTIMVQPLLHSRAQSFFCVWAGDRRADRYPLAGKLAAARQLRF